MTSKTPIVIIYTEGKTDWKHLKKAKEKLNINLNIAFNEDEQTMGGTELLRMCQYLSKTQKDNQPRIFIFDYDDPEILKKVEVKEKRIFDYPEIEEKRTSSIKGRGRKNTGDQMER